MPADPVGETQMRSRTFLSLMIVSALVGLLVLGGCGGQGEDATQVGGTDAMSTDTASSEGGSETGIEVGQYPPTFTLTDLDGNNVALGDFRGSVVVVDLWATWCPPCRDEIPVLIDLYSQYRDEGLVILGVGLDRGGAPDLVPFVEKYSITYPILVGGRAVSEAYKVTGIPTTFIIGRDGRIVAKHVGFAMEMVPELTSEIVNALSIDVAGA